MEPWSSGARMLTVRPTAGGAPSGSYIVTMHEVGEWVEYQIPLGAFGNPAKITDLTFQNWSAEDKRSLQDAAVYFDDIGLL